MTYCSSRIVDLMLERVFLLDFALLLLLWASLDNDNRAEVGKSCGRVLLLRISLATSATEICDDFLRLVCALCSVDCLSNFFDRTATSLAWFFSSTFSHCQKERMVSSSFIYFFAEMPDALADSDAPKTLFIINQMLENNSHTISSAIIPSAADLCEWECLLCDWCVSTGDVILFSTLSIRTFPFNL